MRNPKFSRNLCLRSTRRREKKYAVMNTLYKSWYTFDSLSRCALLCLLILNNYLWFGTRLVSKKRRRREWTKKQRQSDGTTTRGTKKKSTHRQKTKSEIHVNRSQRVHNIKNTYTKMSAQTNDNEVEPRREPWSERERERETDSECLHRRVKCKRH